jgi:hypothetical protein
MSPTIQGTLSPTLQGTPKTITVFTTAHYCPLPESDKSNPRIPNQIFKIHFHIRHPYLGLSDSLLPSGFPTKIL